MIIDNFRKASILFIFETAEKVSIIENYFDDEDYDFSIVYAKDEEVYNSNPEKYDIILLEISIPNFEGFSTCRKLKDCENLKSLPIICYSFVNKTDAFKYAFEAGAIDFFEEPFNRDEFLSRISTQIQLIKSKTQLKILNEKLIDEIEFRKEIEFSLLEKRAFLYALLNNLPNAICAIRTDSNVFSVWNNSCEKLYSISEEDIVGKKVSEMKNCEISEILKMSENINSEKEVIEKKYFSKNLGQRILRNKKISVRDPENNILSTLIVTEDVTDQKKYMEVIENKEQGLNKPTSIKNNVFDIIAHDLKNPIQILISTSELLKKYSDELSVERNKELMNRMNFISSEIGDLLNDMLEWGKSRTDEFSINPEKIEIFKIIEKSISLNNPIATEKGIKIFNQVNKDLLAFVDANMMSIVIRNLITNAVKFTNNGQIRIQNFDKNEYIEISITDTGKGMKEEDIGKLFNKSVHFSTSGTNDEKGTGLGLLICKNFIEKNNGYLKVRSSLNKGSEFVIGLPKK